MGTDYIPFKLKPGVTEDELRPFVEAQSLHYKSMPTQWIRSHRDDGRLPYAVGEMLEDLHLEPCKEASAEIRDRIIQRDDASYRVYVVINNNSLPDNVRYRSITTILPSELGEFVDVWTAAQALACWNNPGGRGGDTAWMAKFLDWVEEYRREGYGLYWCF